MSDIVERLRAMKHSGRHRMGGCFITSDGKGGSWGGEPIMELVNPDGPKAAARIAALEAECARLNAENEILNRTFVLGMDAGEKIAAPARNVTSPLETAIAALRGVRCGCDRGGCEIDEKLDEAEAALRTALTQEAGR